MKCVFCGGNAERVEALKKSKYRDEIVDVLREFYRCESCEEEFVTPQQINANARAVRNEIREKHGLLSPERIVEIRRKLSLTQTELEELLHTGPKVVVRWENGKVIQSGSHDNMLRLLDHEPSIINDLRQIQMHRSKEEQQYAHSHRTERNVACAD